MIRFAFFLVIFTLPIRGIATDYYWVGGSGNWSDLLHWATTSGGSTYHIQAPTSNDNVIFDQNSFSAPGQVVTINSENVFCKNMDWRSVRFSPRLTTLLKNGVMHIHGSFWLAADMQFDYQEILRFAAPTNEISELNTNGNILPCKTVFDANGRVRLSADLTVDNLLFIKSGTIQFSGYSIDVQFLKVKPTGVTKLEWDNAVLHIKGEDYYDAGWVYACAIYPEGLEPFSSNANFIFYAKNSSFYIDDKGNASGYKMGDLRFVNPDGRGSFNNLSREPIVLANLSFASDGYIAGENTIDNITILPGKKLILASGVKQSIGSLTAVGNCQQPVYLLSDQTRKFALIESSNPVRVEYCNIQDIHVLGKFDATNSTDLGNTDGWNIMGRSPQNLYWVGGTGFWSDPMHWSNSSGGVGGACIPTGVDDVFFDANSFTAPGQSVTISIPNAQCHTISWEGARYNPTLKGPNDAMLSVYGSLRLIKDMKHTFAGNYSFLSNASGEVIQSADQIFNNSIVFNGNGSWKLLDNLEVMHELRLISGTFLSNDQQIVLEHFLSKSKAIRKVDLGRSDLILRRKKSGGALYLSLNATNLMWDAGTSHILFDNANGVLDVYGQGQTHFNAVKFKNVGYSEATPKVDQSIHWMEMGKNGFFKGNQLVDSLLLSAGYRYRFESDFNYSLGQIIARGTCDAGMVYIETDLPGHPAIFSLSNDMFNLYNLYVEDIHATGGTLTCTSSIDGGNTIGWVFQSPVGRRLYWVGGTGYWNQKEHWSLQSGGPGGECLPTPVDDVVFDQNSGLQSKYEVRTSAQGYLQACHDLIIADVRNTPRFLFDRIVCYGSLKAQDRLATNSFLQIVELKGQASDLVIDVQSPFIRELYFRGSGKWFLKDDIQLSYFILIHNGSFDAGGHKITVPYFHIKKSDPLTTGNIDLTNANIVLTGRDNGFHYTFHVIDYDVQGEGCIFHITNDLTTFIVNRDSVFHTKQILFENPLGKASLQIYHSDTKIGKAYFYGSGEIRGSLEFDSLIFSSGKAYWLQANIEQKVNKLLSILGNNCFPIRLSSLKPGSPSLIRMDNGTLLADFIQMKDQKAVGSKRFFAGEHSTDIGGSNVNWRFDQSPDKRGLGILGEDIQLCEGEQLKLTGSGFNDLYHYTWSTGDTTKEITISRKGGYWVEVQFEPGCVIRDSIQVNLIKYPDVELGADTSLCVGDSLLLDVRSSLDSVQYLWEDSVLTPQRIVKDSGLYKIVLDHYGCTVEDSILIRIDSFPDSNLGDDRDVCIGDSVFLSTAGKGDQILWNSGEREDSILVSKPGLYSVELSHGKCTARDTIKVDFHMPEVPGLRDTGFCQNSSATIGFPRLSKPYTFLWSNGETSPQIIVNRSGSYSVTVTDTFQCSIYDSLRVNVIPPPTVRFVRDTHICEGTSIVLDLQTDASSMKWLDNGLDQRTRQFEMTGTFYFILYKEGCTSEDSFNLEVIPLPELHLDMDTSICKGKSIDVYAEYDTGDFSWWDHIIDNPRLIDKPGKYVAEVNNRGCISRDSITIRLLRCEDLSVFIPNVFTPNNDGVNDIFKPEFPEDINLLKYRLTVWNRWGELIYGTSGIQEAWDGTLHGKYVLPGVYVWKLEAIAKDKSGEIHDIMEHGTVTLIR